jgi:hypothetical protein
VPGPEEELLQGVVWWLVDELGATVMDEDGELPVGLPGPQKLVSMTGVTLLAGIYVKK